MCKLVVFVKFASMNWSKK